MIGLYFLAAAVVGLCLGVIVVWAADRYIVALWPWERLTLWAICWLVVMLSAWQVMP